MDSPEIAHYRIASKLGHGGMGEVYLAQDTKLGRKVAIKLLPGDLSQNEPVRQRFLAEARAASALNHPNVCVIYEVGETSDRRPYISMEFLEGQTLAARIQERPVEVVDIVRIGLQIADALDAAHSLGIVHRDIKPANISLNKRGEVKVLDFGLAKRLGVEESSDQEATTRYQTQVGQVLGTPNYMSPEQALGNTVDHRSDVFSLGVVLYELVTQRPPFASTSMGDTIHRIVNKQPEPMARFNYEVPGELERIILKCLHKSAEQRYQGARELLVDLRNLQTTLASGGGENSLAPTAISGAARTRPPSAEASASSPAIAAAPTVELNQSDVFINCTLVDDQPLLPGKPGWVSQFKRNLELRMQQLTGEPVRISSYPVPDGSVAIDERLFEQLTHIKAMVSVVSPPFVKSEVCRREVERFWQSAEQSGTLWVGDKSRIFKVLKTPVPNSDMPPGLGALLSQLLSFQFCEEDPETGRWREFDESFGPEIQQRYFEKVYDLAHDICQVLNRHRPEMPAQPVTRAGSKTIYLAATTSDLRSEHERVQRELLERGHTVLPDGPLPLVAGELEERVRALLEESQLCIHLIGDRYGMVPEDGIESLVESQNRLAAEATLARGLPRLIWMPRGLAPRDERQSAFVRRVRSDLELQRGAEIVEGGLNELKSLIVNQLSPPIPKLSARGSTPERGGVPQVYLICDQADETAIESLEDFLFEQHLEVRTPDFEAEESEAATAHMENLKECDGVIVYYGNVRKSWVETALRDLLKAPGYGRQSPFSASAVYLAAPLDRRKERFRTHAVDLLRQEGEFQSDLLKPFIAALNAAKASA